MATHPRVVHKRRSTITALPLYHSGYLQMKHQKDKNFKKFYAELRGTTLFLYKDDSQETYAEKLELEQLKSLEFDSPHKYKMPTVFNLILPAEQLQLQMDNADTAEVWRGYILTVVKREIPSKLQLLPGQMVMLRDTLEEEKRRNSPLLRPPLPPRPHFLQNLSPDPGSSPPGKDQPDQSCPETPECFFDVSREEAKRMLEANPEYGNIIIRRSTRTSSYAVTIRQMTDSGAAIKNFRVSATSKGFVIELDKAVTVPTLKDVIKYFLQMTEYRLQPYTVSQPYDTRLDALPAPSSTSISSTTAKAVPRAQVAPMRVSRSIDEPNPPPAKPDESEYMEPSDQEPDQPNARSAEFDSELQEATEKRRAFIYSGSQPAKENPYENSPRSKPAPRSTVWQV